MKELPKVYDPKQVESKIYDMWMRGGYFAGKADPDKKPFSIVMPPPNVTGQLHMGHALDFFGAGFSRSPGNSWRENALNSFSSSRT